MTVSAALAFLAVALQAGIPPQAGIHPVEYPAKPGEAERLMATFSKCVVEDRRLRPRAERFLRMVPETAAFQQAALGLATPECMPRASYSNLLRFNAKVLRETLFTALYQRDFGRAAPPDLSHAPTMVLASEFDGDAVAIPPTVTFERVVGHCIASADPSDSHRLLMTKIASSEEQEALQRVVPQLAGCVPAGQRVEFSRSVFRGVLAEALYKLRRGVAASPSLAQAGAR